MKIHLQIPGADDTMCGRSLESSTQQPAEVTCSHCRGYYNYSPARYLNALVAVAVKEALEPKTNRMPCAVPICNRSFEWAEDERLDEKRLKDFGWRFYFGKWICPFHEDEKVEIPIGTQEEPCCSKYGRVFGCAVHSPRRRVFNGMIGLFPPFPEPVEGWADELPEGEDPL